MAKKRLNYLSQFPNKFDIQIFQILPLYLKKKILEEGKILYSANMGRVYDIAYETIKSYNLFEPHYKDYIEVK